MIKIENLKVVDMNFLKDKGERMLGNRGEI